MTLRQTAKCRAVERSVQIDADKTGLRLVALTRNLGMLPPLVGAARRPDRAIFKMWGSDIWLCDPPSRAAERWMERV